MQACRPSTRQRYRSAIGQLAAVEARESPDLGMAEVVAFCLFEKSEEGQSAPGMRGILSAVRALEDMCIVPPLVGAIHRRIAGGGAKPGAHDYATPEMLRQLWQRATSKQDAHSWPVLSCSGTAFGGSVSPRQSVPSTYLRRAGCSSTSRSRAALKWWGGLAFYRSFHALRDSFP